MDGIEVTELSALNALVEALRRIERMESGVDWSSRPDGMLGEARAIARAALKTVGAA